MTLFNRQIHPAAIVLAVVVVLFLLKTRELHSLESAAAPSLAELTHVQGYGIRDFSRDYLADPFGKALTLSAQDLQRCRQVSLLIPAYESAAAWRGNALWVGLCALAVLGVRRFSSGPYRLAAVDWLRRMALKAEPMVSKVRARMKTAAPGAVHSIVACPRCSQKLRLPAGKGRIRVTCSACGTTFEALT